MVECGAWWASPTPSPCCATCVRGSGRVGLVVTSDAVAGLVGALGRVGPGAVLAAGSGVVAFATDLEQVWRRVDGWGHVLADRGSGAWNGLAGLRAALATEDGVPGGSGALHALAVQVWGSPREWPRAVMTASDAPARLAGFAPAVASLAGDDPVAAGICADAGSGWPSRWPRRRPPSPGTR